MPANRNFATKSKSLSPATALTLVALSTTALTMPLAAPVMAADFASSIALGSMTGSNGFRLDGVAVSQYSGVSVAAIGDINGDGFEDFASGSPFEFDYDGVGRAYVVFGTATGMPDHIHVTELTAGKGFRVNGVGFDGNGRSVSAAGDVNGDGVDDLIVGAPSGVGAAYVIYGKTTLFATTLNASALNGSTGFKLVGPTDGDAGFSVSAAGDVNGDGVDDVVVGAPYADAGKGSAYVVFGSASGFASSVELAGLDGSNGFRLDGAALGDFAGFAVAGAGDVNRDGEGDVIVGAPGAAGTANGSAYVVLGSTAGFASAIELSALAGTNGFRLAGAAVGDNTGVSVAAAGDVNGDGFAEMIVGAYNFDAGGLANAGGAYVIYGKATYASSIALSSLIGTAGFRLNGAAAGDKTGWSVGGAGDVNGDGYDDVAVGSTVANGGTGAGYVFLGKVAGIAVNNNLSGLNGTNGFRLAGAAAGDFTGYGLSTGGDFNGDGVSDVIVGAPGADFHAADAGTTYFMFGMVPTAAVIREGAAAGQYMTGGAFADRLEGRGGNDELEGRGGADILIGSTGLDTASYRRSPAGVRADLLSPGTNLGDALGDTYNLVEHLTGSAFADTLTGSTIANTINGLAGNDILRGGNGADLLIGGMGQDVLAGGSENDRFVLNSKSESTFGAPDSISDFAAGTATTTLDRIDLSAIDANTALDGNQAFTFIGSAAFSATAGQLRVALGAGFVQLSGDVNGDGLVDFAVNLTGHTVASKFNAGDFIL